MKLTRLGLLDVIQYVAKNLEAFKPPSWLGYIFFKMEIPMFINQGGAQANSILKLSLLMWVTVTVVFLVQSSLQLEDPFRLLLRKKN